LSETASFKAFPVNIEATKLNMQGELLIIGLLTFGCDFVSPLGNQAVNREVNIQLVFWKILEYYLKKM